MFGIFLLGLVALGSDSPISEVAATAPMMGYPSGAATRHARVVRRPFLETPRDYPSSAPFDYRRHFNFPWYPLSRGEVPQIPAWRAWSQELPDEAVGISPQAAPQPQPAPPRAAPMEETP